MGSGDESSVRLTIAVPVYNEAGCIVDVMRSCFAVLDQLDGDGEVLVIDDASTDSTPALLAELAAAEPRLRVLRNAENAWLGVFHRRVREHARGEWVFLIGADGEADYFQALEFLEIAERLGVDAVLGYRPTRVYTSYRKIVSRSYNGLVSLCFGARFRDIGWIRLMRRSVFSQIPVYSNSAFADAEQLVAARRKGARFEEVPSEHLPRASGTGSGARLTNVAKAFRDLTLTRLRWFRFDHYYGGD